MKVTIHDVAREAGVSTSTVSRVLSGKGSIAPETVELVRRVAKNMAYVPRRYARKHQVATGGTVSLLISGFHDLHNNSFYSRVVAGIEETLATANYRLLFKTITGSVDDDRYVIDELLSAHDAIMLVGYEVDTELIARIKAAGKPFVLVDNDCWAMNIDCITNDNVVGARRMVSHLIGLGHTRIGFIGGPSTHLSLVDRYDGYKQALSAANIQRGDDCVAFTAPDFGIDQGYHVALHMLQQAVERPTAIFAASDLLAIGVMKAARDLGIAVPGQLSIAGFDDIEMARHTTPTLTTVRVHQREMGMEAGKRLVDLMQGQVTKPLKIVLATELVLRESTASPLEFDRSQHTA